MTTFASWTALSTVSYCDTSTCTTFTPSSSPTDVLRASPFARERTPIANVNEDRSGWLCRYCVTRRPVKPGTGVGYRYASSFARNPHLWLPATRCLPLGGEVSRGGTRPAKEWGVSRRKSAGCQQRTSVSDSYVGMKTREGDCSHSCALIDSDIGICSTFHYPGVYLGVIQNIVMGPEQLDMMGAVKFGYRRAPSATCPYLPPKYDILQYLMHIANEGPIMCCARPSQCWYMYR